MAAKEIAKELWLYMKVRKRYWLVPLILVLLCFGLLLFVTQTSVVAPFIYTLF
jgi:hypothetical protein